MVSSLLLQECLWEMLPWGCLEASAWQVYVMHQDRSPHTRVPALLSIPASDWRPSPCPLHLLVQHNCENPHVRSSCVLRDAWPSSLCCYLCLEHGQGGDNTEKHCRTRVQRVPSESPHFLLWLPSIASWENCLPRDWLEFAHLSPCGRRRHILSLCTWWMLSLSLLYIVT